jgi:hypothetical protein
MKIENRQNQQVRQRIDLSGGTFVMFVIHIVHLAK